MKQRVTLTLSAGLALVVSQAAAQDTFERRAPALGEPPSKHTIEFVRSEFGPAGPVVKGSPYTAEAVTETVQTLADGNRIVRKTSAQVARDGEGRSRRDLTVAGIGAIATAEAPRISVIHDPVKNVSYTLEHASKIARKIEGRGMMFHVIPDDSTPVALRALQRKAIAMRSPEPGAVAGVHVAGVHTAGVQMHENVVIERSPGVPAVAARSMGAKEESLGRRTIEGVIADGARTVTVIPAGQIGNDRAMEIVSERWYSPELQAAVMSVHRDPRAGETTYKLTGIRLGEPPRTLFEPPADYTIKTAEVPQP